MPTAAVLGATLKGSVREPRGLLVGVVEFEFGILAFGQRLVLNAVLLSRDEQLGTVEADASESFEQIRHHAHVVNSLCQLDVAEVTRALLHGYSVLVEVVLTAFASDALVVSADGAESWVVDARESRHPILVVRLSRADLSH